ncbi:MAG TPA: protein phosphatase 2C domain-containing protein [Longimicrobiaceae bacterium]
MSAFGWQDRPVRLTVSGRTDPGMRRSENQDGFLVAELHEDTDGALLDSARTAGGAGEVVLGPRGLLAVVADGMGGASGGSLASRLALETIHRTLRERWSPDRNHSPQQFTLRLREAVERANDAVHGESLRDSRHRGMGTTATAAGFLDGFLYLAQVGDSRAYLVRRGRAVQLTRDQSLVQELVDAGTMTPEEAERSGQGNVLLQAVGPEPSVRVELTYQEMRRGDVVVLCSDGLFRVVRTEEIAGAAARAPDAAALCEELVRTANERGGPDNVTVVAVRADGAGLDEPREGDPVGRQVLAPSGA